MLKPVLIEKYKECWLSCLTRWMVLNRMSMWRSLCQPTEQILWIQPCCVLVDLIERLSSHYLTGDKRDWFSPLSLQKWIYHRMSILNSMSAGQIRSVQLIYLLFASKQAWRQLEKIDTSLLNKILTKPTRLSFVELKKTTTFTNDFA